MGSYRFSETADRRLAEIYEFSILTFGELQADLYYAGLHRAFLLIADNSAIGREMRDFSPARRMVHQKHSIFYLIEPPGVVILDILGSGQDPDRHLDLP